MDKYTNVTVQKLCPTRLRAKENFWSALQF